MKQKSKHWLFCLTPFDNVSRDATGFCVFHRLKSIRPRKKSIVKMSLVIREGAIVELRGSRDDWQVIGQKHDGLVYKYIIQSRNTGEVKTAFAFEVFEKYTSTYFEINQFLFENLFSDDPMFNEISIVPDSDLASTLRHMDHVVKKEPDNDLASLLNKTDLGVKQEPVPENSCPPATVRGDNNVLTATAVNIPCNPPPKKRFKQTTQDSVKELLSHTTEISTKRSTKWAVSTLKGMCHIFCVAFLFHS